MGMLIRRTGRRCAGGYSQDTLGMFCLFCANMIAWLLAVEIFWCLYIQCSCSPLKDCCCGFRILQSVWWLFHRQGISLEGWTWMTCTSEEGHMAS